MSIKGGQPDAFGWFGNLTQIKLLATDFVTDNDALTYGGVATNETNDAGAFQISTSAQELYCYKSIPKGYKATGFRINSNVSLVCSAFECDLVGSSGVEKSTPTQYTNTDISITNVNSTDANFILLEIMTTATTNWIFGGTISIERI